MRWIKFIFWLLIIGLIIFVILKRHEVISYLEQFTHGEEATVSTGQTNNTATESNAIQPLENSSQNQTQPAMGNADQNQNQPTMGNADQNQTQPTMGNTNERQTQPAMSNVGENQTQSTMGSADERRTQPMGNVDDNVTPAPRTDKPENNVGSNEQAEVVQPNANTAQKDLQNSARQAVKNGDYQTAFTVYQEILEANPAQAGVWGELGDMFHQMGQNQRAAQAYANSAIIFNKQGKQHITDKIMPYIERYSPELIERIHNTR